MPLQIVTVPCLADNYAYLIYEKATGAVAVVDVPEAAPVLAALRERGWPLHLILITHHHYDHIDGVAEVRQATGAQTVGNAADQDRLPPLDLACRDGDTIKLGNESCDIVDVSGHTIGHIAYIFARANAAFTSDSLMAWGCGRVLEGTFAMQWNSLSKFLAMPPDMMIYSGHEYTLTNARFALSVDPDNPEVQARAEQVEEMRNRGAFTVPVALSTEFATNPFLRAADPAFKAAVGMTDASDAEVFAEIRTRKDNF